MAGTLDFKRHIDYHGDQSCTQKYVKVVGRDGTDQWFEVTDLVQRHMFPVQGDDVVMEEEDKEDFCYDGEESTWGHYHPGEAAAKDDTGCLLSEHARHFDAVYFGTVYVYTLAPS
jgi:hypothetical protein